MDVARKHNGCSSARKSNPLASAIACLCILPLLAVAACAPRRAPAVTESALRYKPVTIATGIPAKPGCMSWSPDGTSLALIGTMLTIYDTKSRELTSFPIDHPFYVAWSPDGIIYTLSRGKAEKNILCSLDRKSSRIKSMELEQGIDALYPIFNGKTLILVSAGVRHLSFGTVISNRISMRDATSGLTTTVYSSTKTVITKNPNSAVLKAWTNAGPNPLDNAILLVEHVIPPDVPSYSRVSIVDPETRALSEVFGPDARKTYLSASWAPDGKRAAMTDGNGRLEIRDRLGKGIVLDSPPAGLYPSWDPRGSRIYLGGYLIDADGKNGEALLTDAGGSLARWSPDGSALAIATGDDVLLFRSMRAF